MNEIVNIVPEPHSDASPFFLQGRLVGHVTVVEFTIIFLQGFLVARVQSFKLGKLSEIKVFIRFSLEIQFNNKDNFSKNVFEHKTTWEMGELS